MDTIFFDSIIWLHQIFINFYRWLSQADIDNSGSIDYGEFLAATLHLNKMDREENLIAAFSFFDKDGSGYITIDELQQACKEFGLGDVHLDDMIKEIDEDNVSTSDSLVTLLRFNICVCVDSSVFQNFHCIRFQYHFLLFSILIKSYRFLNLYHFNIVFYEEK